MAFSSVGFDPNYALPSGAKELDSMLENAF